MDPRFADDVFRRTPELFYAFQLYQAGHLEAARREFGRLARADDSRELAAFYLKLIDRALAGPGAGGWTLNLPAGGLALWETDWLKEIFGAVITAEVVDDRSGVAADRSIIVDYALNDEKDRYYRRNFEHGVRQVLIHLSDEDYASHCSAYRWCERVYRNYWSPLLANLGHVTVFPLGYKAGFAGGEAPPRTAAERAYLWSFVGDPAKTTRVEMLSHMRAVPGGFEHLISGWDSADSLSAQDYRNVLDQSVFAPCPAGNVNLDCFRVYEALEAGCIPIVERRPGYDYFGRLLPGHPMPTVAAWEEARRFVETLGGTDAREALRLACSAWWAECKRDLIATVRADLGCP